VLAVREVADRAVRQAREEKEPRFIEAMTYRYRGHSISDPGSYRTKEEIEHWRERDPVLRMENYLKENDMATGDDIKAMHDEAAAKVQQAVVFAEQSPFPPAEALYEDVYAP